MSFETWVSIAVLIGTGTAICALMLRAIGKLDTKIDATRNELGGRIDASRAESRDDLGKVEGRLTAIESRITAIESRTYDISTRLPPIPASASGS